MMSSENLEFYKGLGSPLKYGREIREYVLGKRGFCIFPVKNKGVSPQGEGQSL